MYANIPKIETIQVSSISENKYSAFLGGRVERRWYCGLNSELCTC
jgi:hypothetical protein